MARVNFNTALTEILDLLSAFFASDSSQNFTKLLDRLEEEIVVFRKDIRQKQRRRDKENGKVTYSRNLTVAVRQEAPSAATRSRAKGSQDEAVSTLRSHAKSKDALATTNGCNVSHLNYSRSPSPESTAVAPPPALTSSKRPAELATIKPSEDIRAKLERQIQTCKSGFHGQNFTVAADGHSETVYPDEIGDFFSRFQEGCWLSNFNLMPLIFSFPWPSTTLLLHSSYMPSPQSNQSHSNLVQKKRWPLESSHDRIILPCCFDSHWTLFEVDLKRRTVRQYNSLAGDVSESAQSVSMIEERLLNAMEGQSSIRFTRENGVSQQQSNTADCGVFMVYNAECLAFGRNTLEEQVTGIQLRYRFLERLLQLERQGKSERQIMDMVLGSENKMRIKRRRIPPEISCTESSQDELESKKPRMTDWTPPSHLSYANAWLEERDHLARIVHVNEKSRLECPKRAEELLSMIEAIGCHEVMIAWDEAVLQWESQAKAQSQAIDSTAKAICRLTERTEVRTFVDKVMVRIGKWMFAIKILQDVEKFRRQKAPSKRSDNAETAPGGNAVTRAMTLFMNEVNQSLTGPDRAKEREQEYRKYKKWWDEGQIWVALSNAVGAGILLLIPGRPCATNGHGISNKHFVTMRSGEREPFIKALQKLRPDLVKARTWESV